MSYRFPSGELFSPADDSEKVSERPEVQVEVAVLEAELGLQLVHASRELHEGLTETLDLLVRQRSLLHATKRLSLHQLPKQLDECEDELREPLLDLLGVGVDPARKRIAQAFELAEDGLELAGAAEDPVEIVAHGSSSSPAKLYGGHGPVQTIVSAGWAFASSATRSRNAGTSFGSRR